MLQMSFVTFDTTKKIFRKISKNVIPRHWVWGAHLLCWCEGWAWGACPFPWCVPICKQRHRVSGTTHSSTGTWWTHSSERATEASERKERQRLTKYCISLQDITVFMDSLGNTLWNRTRFMFVSKWNWLRVYCFKLNSSRLWQSKVLQNHDLWTTSVVTHKPLFNTVFNCLQSYRCVTFTEILECCTVSMESGTLKDSRADSSGFSLIWMWTEEI